MGRHRGAQGFRGVSRGPVIALVSAVVLVLAVVGWFQLRERTSEQGVQAAQSCVEGPAVLEVAADPAIAPQIRTLAARYTATSPVVRDHCMSVHVTSAPTRAVGDALVAATVSPRSGAPGPEPALWIPSGSQAVGRLAHLPGVVDGQPKSVATTPVVLAVPTELGQALNSTRIGWQQLPTLASNRGSLAGLGLDGWGSLRLALPTGPDADATARAVEAVAAAVAGVGPGPVTAAVAGSAAVTSAVAALGPGNQALAGRDHDTTAAALSALAAQHDPRSADFHAVPVTEQQLYAAETEAPALTEVVPAGATPVADYPAAILKMPWVDETRSRAAAQFVDFLRRPEQATVLSDAGFRVEGAPTPRTVSVPFPKIEQPLLPADPAVTTALMTTLTPSG